ncbi:carbon-nitrogen hydrolase [Dactylonectria estremocensis]|uniref:nitrilase n=1 Tax=Dactylonectria estremocensis TaxID=1079267 RepID=A0A9P9F9M1_9HYPO|nr:carbon-nitrogen hydrolase [Dactylonectria estremocensis]
MSSKIKIAAVQAEPVWNNLQGGVDKVISLIKEAGSNGANVVGFPEVFIPGYPWSIWEKSVFDNLSFMNEYFENSLQKESKEMDQIKAAVREAGVFIVLGYSERYQGSLYIAQSFIDPTGTIVHHRRKIKPTHVERAYWGDSQAESLQGVVQSQFGKIGGLNCWEHSQPLLRYYQYSQDVDIHVASWPLIWEKTEGQPWPYHITGSASNKFSQVMAMEGACFVMTCTEILTPEGKAKTGLAGMGNGTDEWGKAPGGGFTMIYGPDGSELCEPLDPGVEAISYAEIDLSDRAKAKQNLDVVGHYSRPDLLSLRVTSKAAAPVHFTE